MNAVPFIMAEPREFFTSFCSVPTCGILHSVAEHVLNRAIEQNTLLKAPPSTKLISFKVKDCTREEIENELKHRGILFDSKKRSPNNVIHFPSTPPIILEISIRRKSGGLARITKPSIYDQKIAMGCTHWLFLDITTSSSYLMEMDPSAPSPLTAEDCENMLIDKKTLLSGPGTPSSMIKNKSTKVKSKPSIHMSQSHVMFPLINRPSHQPSQNPSLPRVYPPDFDLEMLSGLPTISSELLKSFSDSSSLSMPGSPILLVSDLERPLKEDFSNDEDTTTPIFPAEEHPELTYLLRYFSIVEVAPMPITNSIPITKLKRQYNLFSVLDEWIEQLLESVKNGDDSMGLTFWDGCEKRNREETEYNNGMSCDFWTGNITNVEKDNMENALGFNYSNQLEAASALSRLAEVLMERFPLLARQDGYPCISPNLVPKSLANPQSQNPSFIPVEDYLLIKDDVLKVCPPVQTDYATSRKGCSDYNNTPNRYLKPWIVSVCDAMEHLFGCPTEKYDPKISQCNDAWPIHHVLRVLTEIHKQLKPVDTVTKTKIFKSMLSSWKYVLPTAGTSFNKYQKQAIDVMVKNGVPDIERYAMIQRLRTEGIILLDLGKMRASAIDYLVATDSIRLLSENVHGTTQLSHEQEAEKILKVSSKDIFWSAKTFFYISFIASAMKAMLSIGIDGNGRRAREPRNGTEYDIILDGIAMGHAVKFLASLGTKSGVTYLPTNLIFALLAMGTKEVTSRIDGTIVDGPPMWAITNAIVFGDQTGMKENLDTWHQTLRRTDSSDDTSLMHGIISNINGIRDNPWKFFKNR